MTELLPNWSDTFPSDPAVTILELVSYLTQLQETQIDCKRAEHLLSYLKLLGESPRTLTPSLLLANTSNREGLYPEQRFFIDGVPFEVQDGWQYKGGQVETAILIRDGVQFFAESNTPLSLSGDVGTELNLTFNQPLLCGIPVRLWCQLLPELGRIPPKKDTPPPFKLLCQIKCGEQWQDTTVTDDTCGFLRCGYLLFTPPADTDCIRLIWGGCTEGNPQLLSIILEPILLEQRHTRSSLVTLTTPYALPQGWLFNRVLRFFIPNADGFLEMPNYFVQDGFVAGWTEPPSLIRVMSAEPDFTATHTLQGIAMEEITLGENGIYPPSLHLMVEENGIFYDCPLHQDESDTTLPRGCRWDNNLQALCFGDGRDFEPPMKGQLLLAGCALTRGAIGNGAGGLLTQNGIVLVSVQNATNGQDWEEAKPAFDRVCNEQNTLLRAVTCADYETLARCAPALALEQVQAITNRALGRSGAGITLYVKPRSTTPRPNLTHWQRERLIEWLEPFRLIGVPLSVEGPRYVPITVEVTLSISAPIAEDAVHSVVLGLCDSVQGTLNFGATISYATLFSALGGVSGVRTILSLEIHASGNGATRTQEGGLRLDYPCLPYLEKLTITQV